MISSVSSLGSRVIEPSGKASETKVIEQPAVVQGTLADDKVSLSGKSESPASPVYEIKTGGGPSQPDPKLVSA